MSLAPILPRPEARALSLAEMHESERDIAVRLLQLLAGCVESAKDTESRDEPPSTVIWLSGERGTGKTTLLRSVRAAFEDRQFKWAESHADAAELLKDCRERIDWLPVLDLDPLPPSANLLVAVLVRLSRHVHALLKKQRNPGSSASSAYPPRCATDADLMPLPEELRHFDRFIKEVAMCWNGNLADRAAKLDDESYGAAMQRAEERRLQLDELPKHVDKLAKLIAHLERRSDAVPLFVQPIDDADLNPQRLRELVHLLQLLRCRRLVLVVATHPLDIEQILHDNYLGETIDARQGRPLASRELRELEARAQRVTAQALRKYFPAVARLSLRALNVTEALQVSRVPRSSGEAGPTQALASADPSQRPLRELLRVELPEPSSGPRRVLPNGPRFLLDLLDPSDRLLPSDSPHGDTLAAHSWTAVGVLAQPIRAVLDLWSELERLGEKPSGTKLLDFAGDSYLRALKESDLDPIVRAALEEVWVPEKRLFRTTGLGRYELKLEPILDRHLETPYEKQPDATESKLSVVVDSIRAVQLFLQHITVKPVAAPAVEGWLLLLHDLALEHGSFEGQHLPVDFASLPLVAIAPTGLHWHGVIWESCLQQMLFALDWRIAVQEVVEAWSAQRFANELGFELLHARWIASLVAVRLHSHGAFLYGLPTSLVHPMSTTTLEQLRSDLTAWLTAILPDGYVDDMLAKATFLLSAPESGASAEFTQTLAACPPLVSLWQSSMPALQRYREAELHHDALVNPRNRTGLSEYAIEQSSLAQRILNGQHEFALSSRNAIDLATRWSGREDWSELQTKLLKNANKQQSARAARTVFLASRLGVSTLEQLRDPSIANRLITNGSSRQDIENTLSLLVEAPSDFFTQLRQAAKTFADAEWEIKALQFEARSRPETAIQNHEAAVQLARRQESPTLLFQCLTELAESEETRRGANFINRASDHYFEAATIISGDSPEKAMPLFDRATELALRLGSPGQAMRSVDSALKATDRESAVFPYLIGLAGRCEAYSGSRPVSFQRVVRMKGQNAIDSASLALAQAVVALRRERGQVQRYLKRAAPIRGMIGSLRTALYTATLGVWDLHRHQPQNAHRQFVSAASLFREMSRAVGHGTLSLAAGMTLRLLHQGERAVQDFVLACELLENQCTPKGEALALLGQSLTATDPAEKESLAASAKALDADVSEATFETDVRNFVLDFLMRSLP